MTSFFLLFFLSFSSYQEISGRDKDRTKIYRMQVPSDWVRKDPSDDAFLEDTKLPCVTFTKGSTTCMIHTFPQGGIPPEAQVKRWKKQQNDPLYITIEEVAWGGYAGLFLKSPHTLAWALSLGPEQKRRVSTQKTADVTIKVQGPDLLHDEIIAMCETFELIDEIPCAG